MMDRSGVPLSRSSRRSFLENAAAAGLGFSVTRVSAFDVARSQASEATAAPQLNALALPAFVDALPLLEICFEGFAGRYLYHCHILEHEANDMMRPFVVVA